MRMRWAEGRNVCDVERKTSLVSADVLDLIGGGGCWWMIVTASGGMTGLERLSDYCWLRMD